jgi:hypothetical protein
MSLLTAMSSVYRERKSALKQNKTKKKKRFGNKKERKKTNQNANLQE